MRSDHNVVYTRIGSSLTFLLVSFVLVVGIPVGSAVGQSVPPVFDLQFIGSGSPTAINNSGTIIGRRTVGSNYVPLVSVGGQPWAELPVPAGSTSSFPTDINNFDVIVGVSYTQWNPVAVRWIRGQNGFQLEILPRINNDPASYATALNDAGQIVGSRSALGYTPTGQGWVYSDANGFTALSTFGFWVVPRDINNSGIIIGGQERLNLVTGVVDVTGQGPANYNDISSTAINASGQIAGSTSLRSTSLNIISVFRRGIDGTWMFIAGTSRWTTVQSINSLGDIGYGELGAGLFLDGLGTFAVNSLLDPTVTGAGWAITGNGAYINDMRQVVTVGSNSTTGQSGTVLLTASGALPPPTAPTDLAGVAHPATRMEPYNSIDLTWVNTSPLTIGWELQRNVAGTSEWEVLSLIAPGTATHHSDTTVGVNITYNYRVRAVGTGGSSPWSNVITVTSPPTPLDTTPPEVTLLEPVNGANVSGVVTVRSTATDNVAVEYQEISFWNQFTGQEVVIALTDGGGELSGGWDTRQLTPATYRVRAFAYDTMGNWNQSEANVVVSSVPTAVMRVSSITLSGAGSGSNITVSGVVRVVDKSGEAVSGATVTAIWFTPAGIRLRHTAQTDGSGNAVLSTVSTAGKYRLMVTDVTKAGYNFSHAGSQLIAISAFQ